MGRPKKLRRSPTSNGYVVSDELRAIYHRWNMTAPDERNGGPVSDLYDRDDEQDEEPFLDDLPADPGSPLASLSRTRGAVPVAAGRGEIIAQNRERRARIADAIRTNPNQKVSAIAKKFGVTDPTVYAAAREHGVALAGMRALQTPSANGHGHAAPAPAIVAPLQAVSPAPKAVGTYAEALAYLDSERARLLARLQKIEVAREALQSCADIFEAA